MVSTYRVTRHFISKTGVGTRWDGDQQFYDGIFRSFDSETNTYSVDYDDGDDDPRMKLRKYKVEYDGDRISVVTVYEHNLDDSDDDDNDDASKNIDT